MVTIWKLKNVGEKEDRTMIVSEYRAKHLIKTGELLVRQYLPDGTQLPDLDHLPKTKEEKDRAPLTRGDDGTKWLILDNTVFQRPDHLLVNWK